VSGRNPAELLQLQEEQPTKLQAKKNPCLDGLFIDRGADPSARWSVLRGSSPINQMATKRQNKKAVVCRIDYG
jgi:hypothetical protein